MVGTMEFTKMRDSARAVRARYAAMEVARNGRQWTADEIMLGFLGDVGDLSKLVQGKAGVRPTSDLDKKLAHELADCLWSVMTLADEYGIDLEASSRAPAGGRCTRVLPVVAWWAEICAHSISCKAVPTGHHWLVRSCWSKTIC